MIIKEFIEAAIEGGYDFNLLDVKTITRIDVDSVWDDGKVFIHFFDHESEMLIVNVYELLLYPKAWEAVGKAMDEREYQYGLKNGIFTSSLAWDWKYKMRLMVEQLIIEKDLEEYIATL